MLIFRMLSSLLAGGAFVAAVVALSVSLLPREVHAQSFDQDALQRNFYACNNGYSRCDASLLTEQQKQIANHSALQRNFYACNNGYSRCDASLLTEQQKQIANDSALQRNFYACNNGYSRCNTSLLTEQQRANLTRPSNPATTGIPGAACAENGSCYGDISAATGRPKTVHVQGYYRKDGTYVRGHYRSAPRR